MIQICIDIQIKANGSGSSVDDVTSTMGTMGDKVSKQSSSLSATSSHGSDFRTPIPTASSQTNPDPSSSVASSKMDMERLSFNEHNIPSDSSKSNVESSAKVSQLTTATKINNGKTASVAIPFTPAMNTKAKEDAAVKTNESESSLSLFSPTAAMASQSTTVKRLEDVFLKHQPAGSTFIKTALDKYVQDAISTHRCNVHSAYEPLMRSMDKYLVTFTEKESIFVF
jgi:hypothetical protein